MTAKNNVLAGSDRRKPLPPECVAPGCKRKPRTRLDNYPLCGLHEQRYRKHLSFDNPVRSVNPWRVCTIDGCSNLARSRNAALCEMHYYRRYRTGTFDDPQYKRRYVTRYGYIRLVGVKCDLSRRDGSVLEHRKVLYESIGPGKHKCHWCGCNVRWTDDARAKDKLVVDHLNSVKDDNRIDNLVPSCHRCNASRGLFMWWVMKHKNDPFLAKLFSEAKCEGIAA